jgi:hypothetical protein
MFIKLFFYNSNIKNRKYNFLNNLCYNFQYYSIFFSFIFNFGLGSLQKIIFNSFINFLNILFHLLKKKNSEMDDENTIFLDTLYCGRE